MSKFEKDPAVSSQHSGFRRIVHGYSLRKCTALTVIRRLGIYLVLMLVFFLHLGMLVLNQISKHRSPGEIVKFIFAMALFVLDVWAIGLMEGAEGTRRILGLGFSRNFFRIYLSFMVLYHIVTAATLPVYVQYEGGFMAMIVSWWVFAVLTVLLSGIVMWVKPERDNGKMEV